MDNFIVIFLVKRILATFNFSLLVLFASTQSAHAISPSLEAKGAAIYSELGFEYYIASLYVDDPSVDGKAVIDYNGPQQIKIKVTAKRWSARKWKAQWQDNIAINNEPSNNQALNSDLALFTEFPQAHLIQGDEVLITYQPESGSELIFNGHSLLKTNSKELYSYVLNTWLGKFSPNRIFREKISGQKKLNLVLVQRSHQELDIDRKEKTLAWFIPENNSNSTSSISAATLAAANALKEKQEAESKAKEVEKNRLRLAQEKKQAQQRQLQQAKEAAEKQKLADQQAKKQAADNKILQAEKEKKRLALKIEEARKLKILNQQKYYHELYQWELGSKVNETVAYPPWAKQFNHQGVVDLSFKVNRSGLVVDMVIAESDVSKILIQEVENKVILAAELLPIPKGLKGEVWGFTIHYVFDLNKPEQEALLKPLAPEL